MFDKTTDLKIDLMICMVIYNAVYTTLLLVNLFQCQYAVSFCLTRHYFCIVIRLSLVHQHVQRNINIFTG